MQLTQSVGDGISVTLDGSLWRLQAEKAAFTARAAAPAFVRGISAADWLAQRLLASGRAVTATALRFDRQADARIHALETLDAPRVHVQLGRNENAVLLVESEDIVAWQFPDARANGAQASHAITPREAAFTLVAAFGAHAAAPQRAAFAGWFLERLRVVVLRFVARGIAGHLAEWLEHDTHTGPVLLDNSLDPRSWKPFDRFPTAALPKDRSAKLLLFVHGAFSSVAAGFGELCATPAGRAFLDHARGAYDAVVGWDHRTLRVDPRRNAEDLYEKLRTMGLPEPPTLDIVCHSRGGLVARSLIEAVLPGEPGRPIIGHVVFAGATNAGTELARPENWRSFLDLATNLALAGQVSLAAAGAASVAVAATAACDAIGDFVGYLVEAGLDERVAPGLAAMNPDGQFVRALARNDPGAADASGVLYYAIESNFQAVVADEREHAPREFPRRLALLLANGFIDALMKGARNDLVVDLRSMSALDEPAGGSMKGLEDFGANSRVYHTNYFMQPETIEALRRWLLVDEKVKDKESVA